MKKNLALISLAGLFFAACHSTPNQNSAYNKDDSIMAAKHKDSMDIAIKKMQIQDSIDEAHKSDSAKKGQ